MDNKRKAVKALIISSLASWKRRRQYPDGFIDINLVTGQALSYVRAPDAEQAPANPGEYYLVVGATAPNCILGKWIDQLPSDYEDARGHDHKVVFIDNPSRPDLEEEIWRGAGPQPKMTFRVGPEHRYYDRFTCGTLVHPYTKEVVGHVGASSLQAPGEVDQTDDGYW